MGVPRVLKGCVKGVEWVLEVSNKSVSRVLEGSHTGVKGGNTGILRCNNGVTKVLQECYQGVIRV